MQDYAPLLERAFTLDLREHSYPLDEIDGTTPDCIRGTYYLNGPARFSVGGLQYRNWLDGDGMVCALRFTDDHVQFTNRFVRSVKFVEEEKAGRPLFRMVGTAFESDRLKRGIATESPINVSVYPFGETLLAFGEHSVPFELDPVTLETRGVFTFHGRLNEVSPFSAHPKIDPRTGEMFNFGIFFSETHPTLTLYRFNQQAELLYRKRIALDYACSTHDFSLSPTYAVFYLSPYILNIKRLVEDGFPTIDALTWEPERGSQLRLLSREHGEEVATIPIGQRYCLHLANCFETDGRLTVDVIEYDRPLYDQYQVIPDLFTTVSRGRPVRFVIDVARGVVLERHEIEYAQSPDFPAFDPRNMTQPYHDMWMLGISASGHTGRKFFDQLVHVDWDERIVRDLYQAPPLHYLGGEPVFIGDSSDAGTGVVICQIFDAEQVRSAFVIFDAFHVARGPVATLHLNHPIHLGFHASFRPA